MKIFIYLFILFAFFCSCSGEETRNPLAPLDPSAFPDKKLEELIILGHYTPEDHSQKTKKEDFGYTSRNYCYDKTENKEPIVKNNLRARLYDKEGNLLAEDFLRLSDPEDYNEDGGYSEEYLKQLNYRPPGAISLPAITSEDGLLSNRSVVSYLPYHEEAHKIRIVSLNKGKEVILDELVFSSQSRLQEISRLDIEINRSRRAWVFNEKSRCHIAPRVR